MLWFRRDLRLAGHPALLAAADRAGTVLALDVLDERYGEYVTGRGGPR